MCFDEQGALTKEKLDSLNSVLWSKVSLLMKIFDGRGDLRIKVEDISFKKIRDLKTTIEQLNNC